MFSKSTPLTVQCTAWAHCAGQCITVVGAPPPVPTCALIIIHTVLTYWPVKVPRAARAACYLLYRYCCTAQMYRLPVYSCRGSQAPVHHSCGYPRHIHRYPHIDLCQSSACSPCHKPCIWKKKILKGICNEIIVLSFMATCQKPCLLVSAWPALICHFSV
jgi:hypothetical protein